jgi:hypothetical protein
VKFPQKCRSKIPQLCRSGRRGELGIFGGLPRRRCGGAKRAGRSKPWIERAQASIRHVGAACSLIPRFERRRHDTKFCRARPWRPQRRQKHRPIRQSRDWRQDHRAFLLACDDELEEQVAAAGDDREITNLVNDQETGPVETCSPGAVSNRTSSPLRRTISLRQWGIFGPLAACVAVSRRFETPLNIFADCLSIDVGPSGDRRHRQPLPVQI